MSRADLAEMVAPKQAEPVEISGITLRSNPFLPPATYFWMDPTAGKRVAIIVPPPKEDDA